MRTQLMKNITQHPEAQFNYDIKDRYFSKNDHSKETT